MDRKRRDWLKGAAGVMGGGLAAGLPGLSARAQAEAASFPTRPVRVVVPSPPGGGIDALGRTLVELMSKDLGKPVLIDNKSGAGGTLGAQSVARATPDGYTLLLAHSGPIFYAPFLFKQLAYDPHRDFTFISHISNGSLVMAVPKDVPVRSVAEFIKWTEAQGSSGVSFGSYGAGSASHLLTEYLNVTRKLGMVHLPYRGEAPMTQDLLAGRVSVALGSLGTLLPHISTGKLRAIGVIDSRRAPDLPNVPTLIEQGFDEPELRLIGGMIMLAPAATPEPVVKRLEAAARAATQLTAMKARLRVYGMTPVGSTSAEARQIFDRSMPSIERLVRVTGTTPQ